MAAIEMHVIPARQGRAVRLNRGQSLKIINTSGNQVVDTWAFNAADVNEFMSMEHMRSYIERLIPRPGDTLVSNHRRPILTLVEDTSPGVHDTLIAACDSYRYDLLGCTSYHENCTDNLFTAVQQLGYSTPECPSPFNLWMNVPVGQDGSLEIKAPVSGPGDYVVLQAELDCIVAMSACPQDILLVNARQPTEVHYQVQG